MYDVCSAAQMVLQSSIVSCVDVQHLQAAEPQRVFGQWAPKRTAGYARLWSRLDDGDTPSVGNANGCAASPLGPLARSTTTWSMQADSPPTHNLTCHPTMDRPREGIKTTLSGPIPCWKDNTTNRPRPRLVFDLSPTLSKSCLSRWNMQPSLLHEYALRFRAIRGNVSYVDALHRVGPGL
jgi:hypothetical protein